ncbi:hypothetical protein Nans01_29580 [Nocardiopsis ansamitocini]|uniref:Glycosyltransferase 2-like domain-containing protein n=1 Tax=Nocardiopsis ansamitocini TaxID=1670832 RepID=A0A9W6P7U2_9ACTN|nr:hypothetical protein Nans01_29580 [Nocardiopsis ansamitocini]
MDHVDTRVFRNDWKPLAPPPVGEETPRLSVSVVIPARGGQARLDLTLASLAEQTYPAHLIDVVVVDDHSAAPLRLPALRPARCRIERAPDTGWGVGHARAYGAHVTSGEVICWLDPDLVAGADLIATLVRWQHVHPETVTLGSPRFASDQWFTPAETARLTASGALPGLLADARPHAWVERLLHSTTDLCDADHLGFQAFVGSCATVGRALYEAAGGVDPALTLGHDTELGYRLWQAGGVFVPDRAARVWHLGPATPNRTRVPSPDFRAEVLSGFMPHPRVYREQAAVQESRVPLVRAVVDVTGVRYELVRACVDRLLSCSETDLEVTLVADWDGAGDSGLEARLVQANYLSEPRVGFAPVAPRTGFPSPYLLELPVEVGVGRETVALLVARAERSRAGLTELGRLPGITSPGVRLWRTRAVARALRVRRPGEDLALVVAEIHGRYRTHSAPVELIDLTALTVGESQQRPWPGLPAPRRESVPYDVPPPPRRRTALRRAAARLTRSLRSLRRR